MIKLLAQIILAARSDDVGGWMNILVVVLLAVCWAIWGVLKTRARKTETETEEEEPREISEAAISGGKACGAQAPASQPQRKPFDSFDKTQDKDAQGRSAGSKPSGSKTKKKRKVAKSSKKPTPATDTVEAAD